MSCPRSLRLLVWTLICGQVYVSCKPPAAPTQSKSEFEEEYFSPASGGVQLGGTKGFEIKNGYRFNLATAPDGTPYTKGWAYLGGMAGPGPQYYRDDYSSSFLPEQLWSGSALDFTTGSLYVVSAVVACSSLWYIINTLITGGSGAKKSNSKLGSSETNATETGEKKTDEETKAAGDVAGESKSRTRRRRNVQSESDADLTRLASIVLNAIASGECLQKTICQVGTQIGQSPKGRMAFTLIDTLLPTNVHANQYFVTMKKALRGDTICDKFNCHYSTYQ